MATRIHAAGATSIGRSGKTGLAHRAYFDCTDWRGVGALAGVSPGTPHGTSRGLNQVSQKVQHKNPGDFWANFIVGNAAGKEGAKRVLGYFRAALAIRPDATIVYNNIGVAPQYAGRLDEATEYYQQAIHRDPAYAAPN